MTKIFQVDLVGVEVPEEREVIHDKVNRVLRGPLRMLKNPKKLSIHYKKHEKEGTRHLYELNFKLDCEYGKIATKAEGWDLLDVTDKGLEELEKMVRKEKRKRTE